jgi:Lauroyl/myristoyl acyltransferase
MTPEPRPTLRHWLEYAGLTVAVWVVGRLPYGALRRIAVVLGALVYCLDHRGRAVALANLDAAFGDKFSPARKRRIACASYQTFARSMLELFWSPNLTREFVDRVFRVRGVEHDSCHSDPKQAVIYVCLHYSNFEWLSQMAAFYTGHQPVVTQRFKNPLVGRIFNRLRSSTGHTILPQERAMIRMLKHLKGGGKFNMLVDLNLDPKEPSVIIDEFGGLKTCVTQMHAVLAERCNAKLVPAECRPLPDGTYEMRVHPPLRYPPDATPAQICQLCWDVLEPSIHEQPECWLWSYKHWRFRPANDTSGRYPFYANVAKRFDKLLKSHV